LTAHHREPLNILWLQSGAQFGGTELMNLHHCRRIAHRRYRITNCFLDEEGPVSVLYRQSGDEPIHLCSHERPVWAVWRDLKGILQAQPFDIVHIFGLRANLLGRLAARLHADARVITGQRNIDSWRKPWHIWADRFTSRWVDLYITNSLAAKERLEEVERIPPHKILTIHNGLDVGSFADVPRGTIRPALGIAPDELVATAVANLREQKAHEVLLRACRRVHDQGIAFHLLLVGEGPRRRHLGELAGELELGDWVHFLGQRNDVPAILADSDVKVLSSRWEGLPGAIMEAMASKLPVVATKVGGVPELLEHGHNSFLVESEDPGAFAQALRLILTDGPLRKQMGQAGYERIIADFQLDDKVAELGNVYDQLARGR
jgi:glycosyltransferase involved in cell wall biosynthesis